MRDSEKRAFLNWLDEQDGYDIRDKLVRDEWPEFYDEHQLVGVTVHENEDGEVMVPKRDYRDAVLYGYARD